MAILTEMNSYKTDEMIPIHFGNEVRLPGLSPLS